MTSEDDDDGLGVPAFLDRTEARGDVEPEPVEPEPEEDDEPVAPRRGHNSGIPADQLKAVVKRIERLEEEKQAIADDIKEVYAEAKAGGFDTKTIRTVVRLRKQDPAERQEQQQLVVLYLWSLGMAPEPHQD